MDEIYNTIRADATIATFSNVNSIVIYCTWNTVRNISIVNCWNLVEDSIAILPIRDDVREIVERYNNE